MTINIDKKMLEDHEKIELLETAYLSEISSLSKIFITLSIAMLGLSMSKANPYILKSIGNIWIILTWLSLVLSAFSGFMEVFFFSRRFIKKAEYIQSSLLVDVILHVDQSKEKLQEFIGKSNIDKESFDRQYKWCIFSIACQAILLLLAFIFFSIFIWKLSN